MYNFLTKHGQMAALSLGILVIAIFLGSVIAGFNANEAIDMSTDLNDLDDISGINFFNPGIAATAFLTAFAAFLALVVFGIINILKFPKSSMKFAITFVALIVIFGILYSTSTMETTGKLDFLHKREGVSENVSKFISGGIKTTVGLAIAAFAIMVISEVRNVFK